MKLKIKSFSDAGNLKDERIGFEVLENCDLSFFIVHSTSKTPNGFYNRPQHTFWFYPLKVNAGDEVVLYTKTGTDSKREENDKTIHFIYWGLNEAILKEKKCIVLVEVENWVIKTV